MLADSAPLEASARWRSPLLWCVLLCFAYLTLTGFALLFARTWLSGWPEVSSTHLLAGLFCLVPYTIYQVSHYARVRLFHTQIHFKLGLLSFYSFLASALSGVPLTPDSGSVFLSLLHIMSSFAFLIFISAHLAIVARIASTRLEKHRLAKAK